MKENMENMRKTVLGSRANSNGCLCLFLSVCLKILMDIFYVTTVTDIFRYHYYQIEIDVIKYFFSWIVFIVILMLIPREENSLKAFFLHIQLIVMILPLLTIYAFTEGKSTQYLLIVVLTIVVECLILRKEKKAYQPIRLKGMKSYINVVMVLLIPACTVLLIAYGGFNGLSAFDVKRVYEIRGNASYPLVLSYLKMWMIYTIIPFYIVYCLEKKKYILSFLLVVNDLILYMVLAQKVIYLSLVVILSVYYASKTKHLVKVMYIGFCILLFSLIVLNFFDARGVASTFTILLVAFMGDRFLFGPALNKFIYFDIFSHYPKLYFSDGLIGRFMGSTNPYKYGPGQMTFAYIWNGRYGESNSCTGYLGDGYAQLGIIGVLGGGIILAFLIKYISQYQGKISYAILSATIAFYVISLNDTALHTVLMSCGLFVFLVLLAVYSHVDKHQEGT